MQLSTHFTSHGARRLAASLLTLLVLSVSALAQTPVLTLNNNVSIFDFIRQNINTTSAGQVVTLSNSGAGSLSISTVTVTGANPADFLLSNNTCNGAVLAAGATCVVTVRFKPLAAGVRNARLTVTDSAAGSQHLIPLTGIGLNPAVPNRNVGPIDPRHGFPLWHQDDTGRKLALCLDNNGLCLSTPPNPSQPASVTDTLLNFPGEAFWWSAEATVALAGGGEARLVLAKEAAFTTEEATIGNQISFDRVRVRIDNGAPNTTYTFTHPFGSVTATTDEDGELSETEDIGCGASPCDFRLSLKGKVGVFLRWDPAFAPAAPAGYLGDPNVAHRVTGSPLNQNFFRVAAPNVGGAGVNSVTTNLFNVSGKIFQ